MSCGVSTVRLLRVAAAMCGSADEDQRWLGATIKHVIEERGSFDEAFATGWAQRLGARNAVIRELHHRYFPDNEPYAAAARIERLAKDVVRLRNRGHLDQIALDDPRQLIVEAMSTGLSFPRKRQLINVLAVQ